VEKGCLKAKKQEKFLRMGRKPSYFCKFKRTRVGMMDHGGPIKTESRASICSESPLSELLAAGMQTVQLRNDD